MQGQHTGRQLHDDLRDRFQEAVVDRQLDEMRWLTDVLMCRSQQGLSGNDGARPRMNDGLQRDAEQSLVDALAQRLPEGVVRLGNAVAALRREQCWQVALADGGVIDADAVVLATPAHQSARFVAELDPALAAELTGIPYASSATVSLAYRREEIPHPLDGFGFVVPLVEARSIVACTYSSIKYPGRAPREHILLRAFVGGAMQQRLFDQDDAAMAESVRRELRELLGVTTEPVLTRIHRHPQAMPQYRVGHLERMQRIDASVAQHPGLTLAGNAYRGVGIPDCIHSGELAAAAAWASVASR